MAEYIDKNELLATINRNRAEAHNERCAQLLEAILQAPTEDVVPKSEVERLEGELILAKALAKARLDAKEAILCKEGQEFVAKAKQEVALQIINEFKNMVVEYVQERDLLLVAFKNAVAYAETELKKKYIGDTQ
ncbi:MAG: hypothetical protein E7602_06100 [Ruminococcaceae bacterium]|nr:hypothetical protein [Oscillospiraceae bacterium]